MLVINMDQLSFKAFQNSLQDKHKSQQNSYILTSNSFSYMQKSYKNNVTHIVVKVHEVGHNFDIGVVDTSLSDDFLQDISQTRWEDKHWNAVLLKPVKELLKPFPVISRTRTKWILNSVSWHFSLQVYKNRMSGCRSWNSGIQNWQPLNHGENGKVCTLDRHQILSPPLVVCPSAISVPPITCET